MAGYGFLGLTYGIYMHELGFNFLYPMVLALTVYPGSVEFLLGNMLLGSFHPPASLPDGAGGECTTSESDYTHFSINISEPDYTHFSINTKVMKPRRRA